MGRFYASNNSKNELKFGKLVLADGKEYSFKYEELTPRRYDTVNSIIDGIEQVKALQTIRTSRDLPFALNDKVIVEDRSIPYSIRAITPEIENSQSRFGRNKKKWVISLGE